MSEVLMKVLVQFFVTALRGYLDEADVQAHALEHLGKLDDEAKRELIVAATDHARSLM